MQKFEVRFTTGCELRMDGDHTFTGYAARFFDRSDEQGTTYQVSRNMLERIGTTAFERTLSDGHDVKVLAFHNREMPLGRTNTDKMCRLKLWTDNRGLGFSLPYDGDYDLHRSIKAGVRNGSIGGMSFSFFAEPGRGERFINERGKDYREIIDCDVAEISFVDEPAYRGSTAAYRSQGEVDAELEQRFEDWKDTAARIAEANRLLGNK